MRNAGRRKRSEGLAAVSRTDGELPILLCLCLLTGRAAWAIAGAVAPRPFARSRRHGWLFAIYPEAAGAATGGRRAQRLHTDRGNLARDGVARTSLTGELSGWTKASAITGRSVIRPAGCQSRQRSPLRTVTHPASQVQTTVKVARMRKLIIVLIGVAVAACRPEARRGVVELEEGVTVSLIIRPILSLQSDWHRSLSIGAPLDSLEYELSEDTGWWRGSNLYRHRSGVYILHEGQAGCIIFTVSPPALVTDPAISCHKTEQASNGGAAQEGNSSQEYPVSLFYTDFKYIGRFVETPLERQATGFIGADKQPEAELPDIL